MRRRRTTTGRRRMTRRRRTIRRTTIYKHQYGFQRGKQTEHNLIHLLNYVSNAINDNKYCMGVFLDIKKAFDRVQHDILFKKLHKLGIRDTSLQWFKSYLSSKSRYKRNNFWG